MIAAMRWPNWQQAAITCLACIFIYAVVRRARPSRTTEIVMPVVHEIAVLSGLYSLWRSAKHLPLAQSEGAMERARWIVDFEAALWLPTELSVQQFVVRFDWLGWFSAAYYAGLHVPALLAFLCWMFWRHRDQYGRWRNALALTTAGCLFIRFVHVAPPRFLDDLGYLDLSEEYGMSVYGPIGTGVSGQFVAMPSIHVAWAAVIGCGIVASTTSRWKWLFAAHFPITFVVVSATGHHWWLDGIVAFGLLILALLIDGAVRDWRTRSLHEDLTEWRETCHADIH
jgi:PAP2 superfamily